MADEPTRITVPVTIELAEDDDVHRAAWQHVKATTPDEETACQQLGEMLSGSVDGKAVIYEAYRQAEAQRQQARQSLDVSLETNAEAD